MPLRNGRHAPFFQVDGNINYPFHLNRGGRLVGLGSVLAGVLASATRAYLSTVKLGILRIDLSNFLFPKIDGGEEAPKNAVGHMLLQSDLLVSVEPTSVTVFRVTP